MIKNILILIILLTPFTVAQELHIKGRVKIDTLVTTYAIGDTSTLQKGDSTIYASKASVDALPTVAEMASAIGDSIASKMDEDFSGLTDYSSLLSATTDPLYVPINIDAVAYRVAATSLPVQENVVTALAGKVDKTTLTDYQVAVLAMFDSVWNVLGGLDTISIIETPEAPTNLASTNTASHTTGSITLTWDAPIGSFDSVWVYVGSSTSSYSYLAAVDSGTNTYTHTGLAPHVTYYYKLRTENEDSLSAYTDYVSDEVTRNWYLGTVSSGTGDAKSWTNKKLWYSFTTSSATAGDSVLFDGGSGDSLVYKYVGRYGPVRYNGAGSVGWYITSKGTSNDKVIFTRGTDDAHDGEPTFHLPANNDTTCFIMYASTSTNIEISRMKFYAMFDLEDGISEYPVALGSDNNIDFIHNTINYTLGRGISSNGSNINISHNYFYTDSVSISDSASATPYRGLNDAIKSNNGSNFTVSYNRILSRVSIKDYSALAHRDIMQLQGMNSAFGENGYVNIHNNFIVNDYQEGDSAGTTSIYVYDAVGQVNVYNNVVIHNNNRGDLIYIKRPTTHPFNLSARVFNNTLVDSNYVGNVNVGDNGQMLAFSCDTIIFKNNLVANNFTTGSTVAFEGTTPNLYDFDYNQYELAMTTGFGNSAIGDWSTWTTTKGQEANSEKSTSLFSFLDEPSLTASDYILAAGSSGIDEGVDLSAYFTTDYRDTTRSGTWDVGAFERVGSDIALWYIDRDASGTGTGVDWTNAATSMDDLFTTASIQAGDSVYISGGADSTTYAPEYLYQIRFTSQVTVTKSWEAGHNGEVYFVNPNNTLPYALKMNRCKNLKVTGLYFRTLASVDDSLTNKFLIDLDYTNNVNIDNCNIVSNGLGSGIYTFKDTSLSITDNYIEVTNNAYSSAADGIHIDGDPPNANNVTITGNTIIVDADVSSYSHKDCIQLAWLGGTPRPTVTIANNLLIAKSGDDELGTGMLIGGGYSTEYLIYNNVIVQRNSSATGIVHVENTSGESTLKILNNTILIDGDGAGLELNDIDTLIAKNNIIMVDGGVSALNIIFPNDSLTQYGAIAYMDINYNIYDGLGSTKFSVGSGTTTRNFTQWQALGHDANSIADSVEFASKWGSTINSYKLITGSPGLSVGTNISSTYSFLASDINAVLRSGWNMGAIEGSVAP